MRAALPILVISIAFVATAAGAASPLDNAALPGQTRYERCLYLARKRPQQALGAAQNWQDEGAGAPARHCAAVALVGLKRYAEAGSMLDQLARDPATGAPADRAVLFDQAGNAWLLGWRAEAAEASLTAALNLAPGDPDILTDRARARAMRKDWSGANADLTAVLARDPRRPDLLVLRASARRALKRANDARADVDKALALRPNYDEALLERGALRFDAGDKLGARADWQGVIGRAPKGPAAAAARTRIEQLDASTPAAKN